MGDISIGPPMPQISKLTPLDNLRLEVTWKEGLRRGKTELVDLSPLIKSFAFYKPLLKSPAFATARLEDDGQTVVWSDGVDMSAMSIERLAEESMNAGEFRTFMKTLDLTQEQAAALLGYGRRQIAHYLAGTKPIPRIVALACQRLVETRSESREFMLSWSSERDAMAALPIRAFTPVKLRLPAPHIAPHLQTNVRWQVDRSDVRNGT
jgi:hypothetical protein